MGFKKILTRNELLSKKLKRWDRARTLIEQDEEKLNSEYCVQLPNESNHGFNKRREYFSTTFINVVPDLIVTPINKVFEQISNFEVQKDGVTKKFFENCTGYTNPMPFKQYLMDVVAMNLRAFGTVFSIIDKTDMDLKNKEEEKMYGIPYIMTLKPEDVVDWEYGNDGKLNWFVYNRIYNKMTNNPYDESHITNEKQQCFWSRDVFEVRDKHGDIINEMCSINKTGIVPVVNASAFITSETDILGSCTMEQTTNMVLTANNIMNVCVYELYHHGGSLLLMPEGAMDAVNTKTDIEGHTTLKKHDNDGMLPYSGDVQPSYLTKQLVVAEMKDMALFYLQSAIENERDMKSVVKKGFDGTTESSSGIAKMMDMEPMTANLNALATDIENYTARVAEVLEAYTKEKDAVSLHISRDFDLSTFESRMTEIDMATRNSVKKIVPTLYKQMWKEAVAYKVEDKDILDMCITEIDNFDVSTTESMDQSIEKAMQMAGKFKSDNDLEEETETETAPEEEKD